MAFKLKSGNSPLFKHIGSSPAKHKKTRTDWQGAEEVQVPVPHTHHKADDEQYYPEGHDKPSPTTRLKEGERKSKKTVRGHKLVEKIAGKRYATKYTKEGRIRKTKGAGYRTKHDRYGKLIQEKEGGRILKEYKPGSKVSSYDHATKSGSSSPTKNYKNPQDYKVFNFGNKPTPVKKRAAWKGEKAHLKRNIDESEGAGTVKSQVAKAKEQKKHDLDQARIRNIKRDKWGKRNTQLETGHRSVLDKEPSMRPKTRDVKREIRQKYRDIKKEGRTVKKHQKIIREDSHRGKKLRAHTLRTKRSKALEEGRKLSAKDYNIRDLEKEVGYERGKNVRPRRSKMPKKVAERYNVDPAKTHLQYRHKRPTKS